MLAYREWGATRRASTRPQIIMPVTAHSGARQGGALLRHRGRQGAGDRRVRRRRRLRARPHRRPNTVALVGIGGHLPARADRPDRRARRSSRSSTTSACTSTAASAGSSSPWGEDSATRCRRSTSACPGVTSISADTHKYGYALKGTLGAAVPAARRCAASSTSSIPTGRAGSTRRRAWAAAAPAG